MTTVAAEEVEEVQRWKNMKLHEIWNEVCEKCKLLGSDGKNRFSGVEYVNFGDGKVGFCADWYAGVRKDSAKLTISIGIADEKVRQAEEGGQYESVAERIDDVDGVDANGCETSSGASLKLWQTQSPSPRKKQMQAEEKTSSTRQNGKCIEGLAVSWNESGPLLL